MVQTRRIQDLIREARSLAYSENYSLTEGWNDNVLVDIFNLGLKRLYNALTQIDDAAYVVQIKMDTVGGQQAYDLPIDVHMSLRLVDVRYIYGTTEYQFIELVNSPIQDRYAYPGNLPQIYCIRDGQILLSPVPTATRLGALEINYQKRMRDFDIRRGILSQYKQQVIGDSATVNGDQSSVTTINVNAGSTIQIGDIVSFFDSSNFYQTKTITGTGVNTISFAAPAVSVTNGTAITAPNKPAQITVSYNSASQKDANLRVNGESVLGLTDYICIVDEDGTPLLDGIPIAGYDQITQDLTCPDTFSFSSTQITALQSAISSGNPAYILTGKYSSTNSELDAWCEAALIEYAVMRLFRLQSNAAESLNQIAEETEVMKQLVTQHRRIRPTVYRAEMMGSRRSQYYPYVTGRY